LKSWTGSCFIIDNNLTINIFIGFSGEADSMEKRAFERVDSNMQVDVYCDNRIYEGAVRNLSKNGLYIDTDTFYPCESAIMVVLVQDDKVFKLSGKVKRRVNTNELSGIGVGLVNLSQRYFKFVSSAMDYCDE
jgi:choline kinase